MYLRIKSVVDYLKEINLIRNQQDFVERIGSDKTTVSLVLNGKRQITKQFIYSICDAFPQISKEWIFTGSGSMLVELGLTFVPVDVPFYGVDFVGGYRAAIENENQKPTFFVSFPPFDKADLWIVSNCNSMDPVICQGDFIAMRMVPDWQSFLLFDKIYLIVTDFYKTIKTIKKSSKGDDHFLLMPINPSYDSQDIDCSLIRELYLVIATTRRLT